MTKKCDDDGSSVGGPLVLFPKGGDMQHREKPGDLGFRLALCRTYG